jgi:methyl-accepting chemotaxis protein
MTQTDDLQAIVSTLKSAQAGDLTVRAQVPDGPYGELAETVNALLASLDERATAISYATMSFAMAAESASAALPEIANQMARQQSTLADVARKLKALEARSEEIGQIIEMLDDVTSETNNLSLNAAIEAARAGTQGKGFGLVAEEVRKMAERAAAATKDIGAYIEATASATNDATLAMEEVRQAADNLVSLTNRAGNEAVSLHGLRKAMSDAIGKLRFAGQGEAEIARILHSRRDELSRLLTPLAPLVAGTRSPLGDAVRSVLAALGEKSS